MFKRVIYVFTLIILVGVIIARLRPKDRMSFSQRQSLISAIRKINSNLPQPIGSIGQYDKVALDGDTVISYNTLWGAAEIDSFYVEYYHEMRELMKYGLLSMNGQNGFGSEFASLLDSSGIFLKMNCTTPSGWVFSWTYSGKELLDFISKINISPTDALYNIINTHINLANLTLPINYKDTMSLQSVATNAIVGVLFGDEQLLRIIHVGDNIILVYKINENDITLRELESYASNDLFIDNMASLLSEDPDVKELMKMLVLAHSNMTYRLINPNASDSVDLEFPYSVLKKHCSINSKILI